MTIKASGSSLGFTEINTEIGRGSGAVNTPLNFLNGYILPASRPGQPNVNVFYGLQYYRKNNAGNCNNANAGNCNCNCGNKNCSATANCQAINCANCDTQKWLQTGNCNVGANPVYNCNSNQNCFSSNCNCNCNCACFWSDNQLKEKHGNITNALEKVNQLNGFYYSGNDVAAAEGLDSRRTVGVSAQEIKNVLPEALGDIMYSVTNEKYLTVSYERIVPLLIEAIKELNAKVDLQNRKL